MSLVIISNRHNLEFNKMIPARNIANFPTLCILDGKTHMEYQVWVCVCGKKALRGIISSKQQKLITASTEDKINFSNLANSKGVCKSPIIKTADQSSTVGCSRQVRCY